MEYKYNDNKIPLQKRLKLFFLNPTKLFLEIKKRNTIELYLVVILFFTTLTAFLNNVLIRRTSLEAAKALAAESISQSYYKSDILVGVALEPVWSILQAIVTTAAYILLVSLVYSFIIKRMDKKTEYIDVLNVFCIASCAEVLGAFLKTVVMLLVNQPIFLSSYQQKSVLLDLLRYFDPFFLWHMLLLIVGFSAVFSLNRKKSAGVVIGVWIGSLLLTRLL